MALPVTILIPARDAAATIARCVDSLVDQEAEEILLIDDFSSDDTASLALQHGKGLLRVLRPDRHVNIPYARNAGLQQLRTPFAVWCDADDAFLPGRVRRLVETLEREGSDVASDAQLLFDGISEAFLRELPVPRFLVRDSDKARLFERNYLPGIGHIAFRSSLIRTTRYDDEQFGGDDSDFLWRLIAAGARLSFIHEPGYRMFGYPGSDSRKLARQRAMVARALRKHPFPFVRELFRRGGFNARVTSWALVSMALFRNDISDALNFLAEAFPAGSDPAEILEPDGPCPVAEGWREGFFRGTILCLHGRHQEAISAFESANAWSHTRRAEGGEGSLPYAGSPDLLNNWVLALVRSGKVQEGRLKFEQALSLFPGYLDATSNLSEAEPCNLTSHPLRMQASRHEY